MPNLQSWGKGGYRRSSIAKRIRSILCLSTEPPDDIGATRLSLATTAGSRIWDYAPEDPRVSPILTYHHQYDFSVADDVDTVETWDETAQGSGTPLELEQLAPRSTVGKIVTGGNSGDYYQYQEKTLTYYAEEGTEQELWFQVQLSTFAGANSRIYLGFTPTKSNAIIDRDYGYGFEYDPSAETWSLAIDNIHGSEIVHERYVIGQKSELVSTVFFRLRWPREHQGEMVSGDFLLRYDQTGEEPREMNFTLRSEDQIREQPLRLTIGLENVIDAGTELSLYRVKEIIPRNKGIQFT